MRESTEQALMRWKKLELVQEIYADFLDFLRDGMTLMGYDDPSEIQVDIAKYLAFGPHYLMVQAQRGQAKTTITALFAVWCIIHDPSTRVLIVSAGGKTASDISTLVVRIIMNMPELECLRPDPSNGDRTSVEGFDIHYSLKKPDKSASVSCIGITGTLQGNRADLLIADDVESKKNSNTAATRALLMELTRDFTSICESGRIIYLGTPQTQDSIYNSLASRGYGIRIWPGRYPNAKQRLQYGGMLAPMLARNVEHNPALAHGGGPLGDQGQPIDPRLGEHILSKKELDQGTAYFQLQHMLNTSLSDALRYPLKTHQLVAMRLDGELFPLTVTRDPRDTGLREFSVHGHSFKLATPLEVSTEHAKLQGIVMYVDPAGGGKNGDETAYAVTGFLNGNIYLLDVGGVPGGYNVEQMDALSEVAAKWKVNRVIIEKNMGYGAFKAVWLPSLTLKHKCHVDEDMVHGQKERRIAETLEPVAGRGSLIVGLDLVEADNATTARYAPEKRLQYSFFYQYGRLTRESGALVHDDRLDAVEGAVRYWSAQLAQDQQKIIERQAAAQHAEWIRDPLGKNRYSAPPRGRSTFDAYRRR